MYIYISGFRAIVNKGVFPLNLMTTPHQGIHSSIRLARRSS